MIILLFFLVLVALAVAFALRSRTGRRMLFVVGCLLVISISGMWGYDIWHRPYMVSNWLNLKQPPKSLSVLDCLDSMLPTDVDMNCLITIDPQEFPELLMGYNFHHAPGEASEVLLATGTRQFPLADTYSVTPVKFEHGGAVTIYADAQKSRAIVNLYIE